MFGLKVMGDTLDWAIRLVPAKVIAQYLRWLVIEQNRRGIRAELVKETLALTGEDLPISNLMLSDLGAVAQFERDLIRKRQRNGYCKQARRISRAQAGALDWSRWSDPMCR